MARPSRHPQDPAIRDWLALETLRPGTTFGDAVPAMEHALKDGGGWIVHPFIHGLNPWAGASGVGLGLKAHAT